MKLYMHPASPNSRRVVMTAAILGIPLETAHVDLFTGAQRKPEYLAINPNGAVPTLKDGDFALSESNAITQYLASKKPGNTLWPNDPSTRADITRWQCWELAHWSPALRIYIFENMFKKLRGLGDPDPAELKKADEMFKRFATVLNNHLANRDYLVGDNLTLADISIASHLMYTQPARIPLDDYPNIKRWFARIEALPAWQESQPRATAA
jgi:glutathione S-transferase